MQIGKDQTAENIVWSGKGMLVRAKGSLFIRA